MSTFIANLEVMLNHYGVEYEIMYSPQDHAYYLRYDGMVICLTEVHKN